ncbi:hypothetical protein ACFLQV_03170 [Calditrichota bacterium]
MTAMFAGTAAAVGYLLLFIPNVEGFTFVLYISGYSLGIFSGLTAAIAASIIYFGINPQGFYPPLLLAQTLGACLAPMAGSILRTRSFNSKQIVIVSAASALLVTLIYDVLTNIAYPLSAGFDLKAVLTMLAAGLAFSVLHILSNILLFSILTIPALKIVKHF